MCIRDRPMTSGPVYVGAFVLFLFILGCFIVKGPLKCALLGATIFSILLSWGKNFMGLTDFFIDYIPCLLYTSSMSISFLQTRKKRKRLLVKNRKKH